MLDRLGWTKIKPGLPQFRSENLLGSQTLTSSIQAPHSPVAAVPSYYSERGDSSDASKSMEHSDATAGSHQVRRKALAEPAEHHRQLRHLHHSSHQASRALYSARRGSSACRGKESPRAGSDPRFRHSGGTANRDGCMLARALSGAASQSAEIHSAANLAGISVVMKKETDRSTPSVIEVPPGDSNNPRLNDSRSDRARVERLPTHSHLSVWRGLRAMGDARGRRARSTSLRSAEQTSRVRPLTGAQSLGRPPSKWEAISQRPD